MLVEHYPADKRFEELLGYIPDLSPTLPSISSTTSWIGLYIWFFQTMNFISPFLDLPVGFAA